MAARASRTCCLRPGARLRHGLGASLLGLLTARFLRLEDRQPRLPQRCSYSWVLASAAATSARAFRTAPSVRSRRSFSTRFSGLRTRLSVNGVEQQQQDRRRDGSEQ